MQTRGITHKDKNIPPCQVGDKDEGDYYGKAHTSPHPQVVPQTKEQSAPLITQVGQHHYHHQQHLQIGQVIISCQID